jgi:hypothetical protein
VGYGEGKRRSVFAQHRTICVDHYAVNGSPTINQRVHLAIRCSAFSQAVSLRSPSHRGIFNYSAIQRAISYDS